MTEQQVTALRAISRDCRIRQSLVWTKAQVGCYWQSGPWHISSVSAVRAGRIVYSCPGSYYSVRRNRKELGRFATLDEAKEFADEQQLRFLALADRSV